MVIQFKASPGHLRVSQKERKEEESVGLWVCFSGGPYLPMQIHTGMHARTCTHIYTHVHIDFGYTVALSHPPADLMNVFCFAAA